MRKLFFVSIIFVAGSFSKTKPTKFADDNTSLLQYVNPFIGTGGHGHTFPGATVPFGMVQLSPDTRIDGSWDGCSGYHHSDSVIYGFSHTHLSGTGCSDWGDIALMPMMGKHSFDKNVYSSKFSHLNEKASAGFYAVKLADDDIDVELTATSRVGFHKYTFNKSGEANIILDLTHRDELIGATIKPVNDSTIQVFRKSKAWAAEQQIYATIQFSKSFDKKYTIEGIDNLIESKDKIVVEINGQGVKAAFGFSVEQNESIFLKVAISSVDYDGAKKNMETELPHWDFEKVKKDAELLWAKELSKISITDNDKNKLTNFYTALYHCMIHPSIANDVDGRYRGMDNKIYTAKDFNYYSVFSLWDTFRALHPLLTIIDEQRTLDFIKTFLEMYKQTGRLPVWELSANETDCMIGYHAVSVITDAYMKGIKNFDTKLALEAMIAMSNLKNYRGLGAYKEKGFLEVEDEPESVSKTLEYAYNDWCIAQFAKAIGNDSVCNQYTIRSQSWKNIFNPQTGFMQPRSNGGWQKEFDAKRVDNNFTEGNSWQYSFFVPQDIYGLINAMGGNEKFEKKLDELFTTDSKTTGREQADITGLIGQYAHGNEPSHHMAYLYNYISKPEKTEQRVKQILANFYKPTPDGLIGNEDCGQMSAWCVMSALGFYQVCPGNNLYTITEPLLPKYTITVNEKKLFTGEIITTTLKSKNFISHNELLNIKSSSPTILEHKKHTYVSSPIITATSQVFNDSILVSISSANTTEEIMYSIVVGQGEETSEVTKYTKPFFINKTAEIIAVSVSGDKNSKPSHAYYYKRPNNWTLKLYAAYNKQYTAGGNEGIIDGLRGDENWRKGRWQGYQGQNFECVIDLKGENNIKKIAAGFLQDQRSWIMMPTKVDYFISQNGIDFTLAGTILNTVQDKDEKVQTADLIFTLSESLKAKHVKVVAYNYGKLPAWHQGAGGDAFIFIDEIKIN